MSAFLSLRAIAAANIPLGSNVFYTETVLMYLSHEFARDLCKVEKEFHANRVEYDQVFAEYDKYLMGGSLTLDLFEVRYGLKDAKDAMDYEENVLPLEIEENCPWYQFLEIFRFTVLTNWLPVDLRTSIIFMKGILVSIPQQPVGPVPQRLSGWYNAYYSYKKVLLTTIEAYDTAYSIKELKATQEKYAQYVRGYDTRRDIITKKRELLKRAISRCQDNVHPWDEECSLEYALELYS